MILNAKSFKVGGRVAWTYTHAIGRSRFRRTKHGVVLGYYDEDFVKVQFDGNKTSSKIWYQELWKIKEK